MAKHHYLNLDVVWRESELTATLVRVLKKSGTSTS